MRDYTPRPKPEKKEKVIDRNYWNNLRSKSAKKKIEKMKPITDKDEQFYKHLWKVREHRCEECGVELSEPKKQYFHHLLPKATHKYFRHEEKNIAILCFRHHSAAESAISYKKMNKFSEFEKRKRILLEGVGITYETKTA